MLDRIRIAVIAAALVVTFPHDAAGKTPTKPGGRSTHRTGCFEAGDGYLRARIRGAITLDLDWKDSEMQCAGGPRPDGKGLRVSVGGPLRSDGRRVRMVFGISGLTEGATGKALPTNVTILFEGEKRIFATQGDDKCTVDSLQQQRVETMGAPLAVYRVIARGFCVGPASRLGGDDRLLLTSFDFAARVEFDDDDRHDTNSTSR